MLGHLIRREVSNVIARDLSDPRIGFVTITDVHVSPDLKHARLYVSVLGEGRAAEESIEALRGALGFIRRRIAPHLDLRYTPELTISYDDTEVRAGRIEKIIDELHSGEPPHEE